MQKLIHFPEEALEYLKDRLKGYSPDVMAAVCHELNRGDHNFYVNPLTFGYEVRIGHDFTTVIPYSIFNKRKISPEYQDKIMRILMRLP